MSAAGGADIFQRIKEWNATRLDLFKISEPNKRNEFTGIVRFYFQGEGSKYQSKCLRISNLTTACQLVNVLVEKFHPDLKMLTAGRYALYEYHSESGERRLGANEAPLVVQLNWAFDEREGRFILRDESKPLPTARRNHALDNQPSSLQNGLAKSRSAQKLPTTAEPENSNKNSKGFARRWSSASRKKKRKNAVDGDADAVPDTTFTRTLSNPDEVLRRRREQRAHNRANGSAEEKGNTLKVYGDSLNKDIPFVTLQLSMEDTADSVVYWTLEKYGMAKMVNPLDFCIVQVNIPPRGEKLPIGLEREQTLHNQDCPLAIRSLASARDNISCVFQIRYRHGPSRDGRPAAPPPPPHPRAPPGYTQLTSRPTLPSFDMRPRDNMPYLMEIVSENQQKFRNGGLFVPLGDLFRRTSNVPLKLGTIEKMVGPLPNILVDKFLHPDVRPVHCTFTAVLASESKTRMPKTARPGELESMSHVSLLISPSLDGFAKPPGPAQIRLNGTRIVGPALVPPDSLLHLGKSLFLKFINPQAKLSPDEDAYASEPVKLTQTKTASDLVRRPQAQEDQHQKMAPEKNHNEARSQHMNGIRNPGSYEMNHQLPLSLEVRGIDISNSDGTLSKYIQLVDLILVHAHSEVQSTNTVIKPESRPSPFPLSPSYSLYLVYRAYQDQTSTLNFSPAERENNISYLTNYISTRIFESVPNCNRDANDQLELVYPFVYWMANSSELLHFLKNDMDLISPGLHPKMALGSPQSPVHVCRQALHMLADSVDQCFYQLRSCMTILLQPLLYPLIYPGDIDLQDDVRQDDRPLSAKAYYESIREPNRIQPLMQLLSLLMQQLRRTRMNVSLTIQLFSQLFHGISAYIFNHVLINTEAKPRNARDDSNIWLTRLGATRLTRRLDRIKQWAQRQGLERAAECHLQRCTQACQLILVDRSNLDEFYQFCMDLLSLNSMQLEWLLAHLADPPPVPDEWIDLIVTGGKEVNDRALTDEMQHYPTSADGDMGPVELQLTEPKELPLPLLLPPDGYASDAVLTGAPTGLSEFLRPLSTKGLIHVKHNPVGDKSTNPYPWSNYLCLNKVPPNGEKSGTVRRIEKPHPKNEQVNNNNRRSRREQQQGREDSDLSDESDDSEDSEPGGHTQRFKPRTNTMRSSANRMGQRQHQSLPDLTVEDFDVMARDANVPVNSIIRFYLKKINNSLGLSIVAAKAEGERLYGIYVKEIVPGGAADRDGRLTTGDQILAIGSTSLIGCAQSDAVGHLAKQSRTDEGILLTIAKGSARHHHILELVRSSDPNAEGPKQVKNGPIAKPRNASQPPASNASELPFDKRPGGLRKIGTPVLPPSTQVGLKPATQQRQLYDQSDGNRHTQNGSRSNRDYKKKSGSLSRSTPSLNLAQVGIEDDSQSSDEYEQEIPKLRMTNGKGDSEHRYRDSYQDADEQPENFSRTKSVELSGRSGVPSDRRARILSPGSSQTPSSGSDIINEGPFPNTNKNRESAHRPSNRRSPARPRDDQPDHGMYGPQGSQSQPNISKVDMPHDPIRHCSLSAEPDRDMANHQLAESVSDIFSSLGSVSSEHTPCSLHDSGNEQPVDLREQRLRPERDGSRERMYSGAERAGPNGSSQALTRDGRSNRSSQRYASESELVNPSGPRLGNPDQNRPKSALQRLDDIDQNRWQENDKDPENKRATWAQENMNGNYNKLPPAGNHFRPRSLQRSLDAINVQSMDGNQRTTINTPATSGSMTPTSVDTVISNPYQGSVTPGTDGPMPSEVFDTNKPFQYGNREKIPTQFGSLDMSHLRPQPTPSSPADDGVSETLMPPPHAVVSGTRWEENQLPSFAPELLPDVPVLQKNPNHGRTKTASEVPEPKKSEAIHFVQSTVVSAPDPGTNSDYTTRMKSSDSSMNNRPPLSKSSYFNQKPAESAVPSNYRRPESYTPIPMSNEVGNRPPPGAFPSTVLTASPPPTPTAEYPQYHPPDRLQPADWSTYTSSSVPEKSHLHSVPQTAPKPNSVAPFSYHLRPETHQIRVRSPSPARYEGGVSPRPELGNAGLSTTHTQHVTQPPLSAAARVAQLESEIASIEAKQNISGAEDINPTLDRLRVELQFQRRLADRESSRIHSTSIMEAQPDLRNDERISSIREVKRPVEIQDTTNRTSQIWEQKRTEAERELENTQNRRLAELEQEHRAMLMRQEQRAKERSEWLEKHQNRSEILRNGTKDDYSKFRNQPLPKKPSNEGTAKPSDSHIRYGRPKFDATQQGSMTTNFAPQYPIQSRLGPQVVESELPRSSPALITGDSQRVKKSVSFDKNLEIISVYSPPGTPQESVAENPPSKPLHGPTISRLPQADRPTNPSSSEYYSRSYATNDLRHLDTEKLTTVPKSKSSMSISRTAGPSVIQSGGSSTSSVNPVPDAELLPFKEKMRLFAQQIGEELPKERSRMSNRQRELLQNPTSAKFGTRPVPVHNDPRSSDFLR